MATKRLPMRQIREILRLKHDQQLSHRAIASACRVGLGTAENVNKFETPGFRI